MRDRGWRWLVGVLMLGLTMATQAAEPGGPAGSAGRASAGSAGTEPGFAAELGAVGSVVLERGAVEPGVTRRDDRLQWSRPGGSGSETIFESGGRRVVEVVAGHFSNPVSKDLLVTLDPGGSGGYVEFVLLGASGSRIVPLWEPDGVKSGRGTIARYQGEPVLAIDHLMVEPSVHARSATGTRVLSLHRWRKGMVDPPDIAAGDPTTEVEPDR